jgi:hypothetical protein
MFISALVNDWNAGYAGIPATAMILAAPPLIYLGGRSAGLDPGIGSGRARLGWTLYALSMLPTGFALYSYAADYGTNVPLIITSGILGSAAIFAMTSYAFNRAETVRNLNQGQVTGLNMGIAPLKGGAMVIFSYRF